MRTALARSPVHQLADESSAAISYYGSGCAPPAAGCAAPPSLSALPSPPPSPPASLLPSLLPGSTPPGSDSRLVPIPTTASSDAGEAPVHSWPRCEQGPPCPHRRHTQASRLDSPPPSPPPPPPLPPPLPPPPLLLLLPPPPPLHSPPTNDSPAVSEAARGSPRPPLPPRPARR